jgi:hypothetical protein
VGVRTGAGLDARRRRHAFAVLVVPVGAFLLVRNLAAG